MSDAPAEAVARLRAAYPNAPLAEDVHGDLRLETTPPLHRASMLPEPLARNPLRTAAQALRRLLTGKRQRLSAGDGAVVPRRSWARAGTVRRLLLMLLVAAQTVYGTWLMTAILPYHGAELLELVLLSLYAVLFAWISAGFWTALMGFWTLLIGRDRHAISRSAAPDTPLPPEARTAVLLPICNEDVHRVYAGLRATYESVRRAGVLAHFDFFILSDTTDADTRVNETEQWLALCEAVGGYGHIHYRRRQHRIKRKSGNIADWCRRWGRSYRYMVILDADSVMSGTCLKRLVQIMEANPEAGIVQTAPQAAGRETAYARIQQFAHRAYGPLFTAGLHFWQLGESHYWGHNAIIRVAPFIRHCALGKLPGRGALAGEILSHDFVEAALMRRAGWAVWIAYDLPGSFEEMPPALLDELRRDQRWCQGNLQNFRLFFAQGLHPAHRAVFMTGVMSYLSAPLWFAFLVLSTAALARQVLVAPQYFTQPYQLFPVWPEWHPEWAAALFGGTMALLFLPKILAVLLLIVRGRAREFGGPGKLIDSAGIEILFSAALAPIRMLFHTRYVLFALLGFATRWTSPPRADTATPWREAIRRHGLGTLLGLGWAGFVYWLNPTFLWWLAPVAGSLILAVPLSVLSSRVGLGRWLRARRLFLIPEESHPPRELRALRRHLRRHPAPAAGFMRALLDPVSNAVMRAAARPRRNLPHAARAARQALVHRLISGGPEALDEAERNQILSAPEALAAAHARLRSPDDSAAAVT